MDSVNAFLPCASGTAIHRSGLFDAMPNDLATAVSALRREGVDRTFKTVEAVRFAFERHREALIVFVPANFAGNHDSLLS
jgi:hypothetical protein